MDVLRFRWTQERDRSAFEVNGSALSECAPMPAAAAHSCPPKIGGYLTTGPWMLSCATGQDNQRFFGGDAMRLDPTPFTLLKKSRRIDTDWVPPDLRDFYAAREGVGLESTADRLVRLCKLSEVVRIGWADLHIFGGDKPPRGWKDFSAIRLGVSCFFDEIVWVLSAPSAPAGSIMTFGPDVAGPGGTGKDAIEGSLLLSDDFDHWITRLARDGWTEYGLVPGSIKEEPAERQNEVRAHFRRLNPSITWGADK